LEVVDVAPVLGARLPRGDLHDPLARGVELAGGRVAEHEQVEAAAPDAHAELDRADRALLPERVGYRLDLSGGVEIELARVAVTAERVGSYLGHRSGSWAGISAQSAWRSFCSRVSRSSSSSAPRSRRARWPARIDRLSA